VVAAGLEGGRDEADALGQEGGEVEIGLEAGEETEEDPAAVNVQ
jgi:hypothetical protein